MDPRRSGEARPQSSGIGPADNNTNSLLNTVLVVLLIVTSLVATVFLASRLLSSARNGGEVKNDNYQALFLTNGQVYFGKLSKVDNSYVRMKDIYYLQVQQQVQPGSENSDSNQQVSLAKLGSELHGPEDVMYVSRDQVLFWENLKSDAKVTQAIKDYKAGKK